MKNTKRKIIKLHLITYRQFKMNVIAEFNDNKGFNVKLTEDKIYLTAVGNEETLALRGVNGVGVYDDLEKYNKELDAHKKKVGNPKTKKKVSKVCYVLAGLFFIIGIVGGGVENGVAGLMLFAILGYVYSRSSKIPAPTLDSYFSLMLTGGDRRFKFDKSNNNAKDIAEFINKVEETLTAYNSK